MAETCPCEAIRIYDIFVLLQEQKHSARKAERKQTHEAVYASSEPVADGSSYV